MPIPRCVSDAIDQQAKAAIPDISRDDAKAMVKQEGLSETDVPLGDAPTHKLPVLKMQIAEAHTRRDRQAAIERGPQGFFPDALGLVTSIGVGMIDPVNAAAFSIPVIGEARMGKILASAGDSILARGAARFGQGAAQGAVGTAALQPADWWLHTRDGQDYTMAQGLESVIMGAGMGGAFHAAFGGFGDYAAPRKGLPLAGSPQDLLLRWPVDRHPCPPPSALADCRACRWRKCRASRRFREAGRPRESAGPSRRGVGRSAAGGARGRRARRDG